MAADGDENRAPAVRVVLGAFEDLVAIGLRELVAGASNVELVAAGVAPDRLPAALGELEPDVVVVNYGSLGNPANVQALRRARPETRVVVLANRPSAAECNQLLSFGATACLSKETEGRDIVNAIHLASRGLHLLPRTATSQLAGDSFDVAGPDRLTLREAEVLDLLQEGRTNAEIAHALSIGVETVRTHARNIYRKLGVSSRRELLRRRSGAGSAPVVVEPSGER